MSSSLDNQTLKLIEKIVELNGDDSERLQEVIDNLQEIHDTSIAEGWLEDFAYDISGNSWSYSAPCDWGERHMCLAGGGSHAQYLEIRVNQEDILEIRQSFPCRHIATMCEEECLYMISNNDNQSECYISYENPYDKLGDKYHIVEWSRHNIKEWIKLHRK